jgi:hypothetical protein
VPNPNKQTTSGTTTTLPNGPGPDNTVLETTNGDSAAPLVEER